MRPCKDFMLNQLSPPEQMGLRWRCKLPLMNKGLGTCLDEQAAPSDEDADWALVCAQRLVAEAASPPKHSLARGAALDSLRPCPAQQAVTGKVHPD